MSEVLPANDGGLSPKHGSLSRRQVGWNQSQPRTEDQSESEAEESIWLGAVTRHHLVKPE
jgi:hypothetical protein